MCDQVSDAILDAHLKQDPDAKVKKYEKKFTSIRRKKIMSWRKDKTLWHPFCHSKTNVIPIPCHFQWPDILLSKNKCYSNACIPGCLRDRDKDWYDHGVRGDHKQGSCWLSKGNYTLHQFQILSKVSGPNKFKPVLTLRLWGTPWSTSDTTTPAKVSRRSLPAVCFENL